MRANHRAIESYGQVKVSTGVSKANSVEPIQMLFDGLIESMSAAKGHILHKNLEDKGKSIARASPLCWACKARLTLKRAATWQKI